MMKQNGKVQLFVVVLSLGVGVLSAEAWGQNNKTRANSYDDGWESTPTTGWIDHCRAVLAGAGVAKTDGFVLQVGDSITHTNGYSQWVRGNSGQTGEDDTLLTRIDARADYGSGNGTATSKNGFYLAIDDTVADGNPNFWYRGMTAASGLRASEFISGSGNGGTAMPLDTSSQGNAQAVVGAVNQYGANLHVDTMIKAFEDAQIAVLMMGTNSVRNVAVGSWLTDYTMLVDKLEAANIVVVLSTTPPNQGYATEVGQYNAAITNLASTRGLPLIDFHAEMMARAAGGDPFAALMSGDGIHPSPSGGGYTTTSDPYMDGGSQLTHTTGAACDNVGYLLRAWLTVQKLKEVIDYVVDGNSPTAPPAPAGLNATPGNGFVQLAWGASAGATGYNVYRSTTSGSGYALVQGNVATTSHTDSTVTNGTTYYYVVTALTPESGNSNQATATPTAGGAPPPAASSDDDDDGCSCGTIGIPGGIPLLLAALLGFAMIMIK